MDYSGSWHVVGVLMMSPKIIQGGGWGSGNYGFDATTGNRVNNWPTYNWNQLAASYPSSANVSAFQWQTDTNWRTPPSQLPGWSLWNPANGVPSGGTGWSRCFLNFNGRPMYISYPVFQSPITAGRIMDMKNGVWENNFVFAHESDADNCFSATIGLGRRLVSRHQRGIRI